MTSFRDPAIAAATRRQLVLIVEDDGDTRAALVELLDRAGYSAAEARDGYEALRLLRAGLKPFAMFIDLTMPEMDGRAFCDACGADPAFASTWRVIVSGLDEHAAARCNAHAYVPKPINEEAIVELLEQLHLRRAGWTHQELSA